MGLEIGSINIRGLGDKFKRKEIFNCFKCCAGAKTGVAILFNNTFSFQISKTYTDPEGRFIICHLNTNGKQITLVNIYAPNEDDPNFSVYLCL